MPDLISGEAFSALFREFNSSAWRWEAQGTYNQPDEVEPWQRWRDGVPVLEDLDWLRPWLNDIRAATESGKVFQRVRMLTEPLTEYLRWQMEVTPANLAAGEEIWLLTQAAASRLGLPTHDFWIFDRVKVAVLHYGAQGLVGAEIVTEPATVARYEQWRKIACAEAVSYEDFVKT
ncbi:DUF6879 family protein [Lentzea sp. HUAS TT2]|uniref:DUF6879 family protein n=1 Tax=Lentzea sp. HUAS TT2 TaxID=3447454 RepID=UPI003F704D00